MKLVGNALLALSLTSGVALAERIADPFERHEREYTLEGPQHRSEVFYLTSNWYDETRAKHDDRFGDALIITTLATALGSLALEFKSSSLLVEIVQKDPPEADHSVT